MKKKNLPARKDAMALPELSADQKLIAQHLFKDVTSDTIFSVNVRKLLTLSNGARAYYVVGQTNVAFLEDFLLMAIKFGEFKKNLVHIRVASKQTA